MFIDNEMAAILGIVFIPFLVIGLALGILLIAGMWRLFKKCGYAGWKSIIPFYGDYIFFTKICSLHWGWFVAHTLAGLIGLKAWYIEVLSLLMNAVAYYNLAEKSGRDKTAAAIFGGIFGPIVGALYGFFKDFNYDPNVIVKENGFINF